MLAIYDDRTGAATVRQVGDRELSFDLTRLHQEDPSDVHPRSFEPYGLSWCRLSAYAACFER